jgi:hypothetical protein
MTPMLIAGEGLDAKAIASLVASLPVSLKQGEGDVLLLHGEGDWPQGLSSALERGQRRIILIDPAPRLDLAAVIEQAEATGAAILLCETHSDHPALAPFAAALSPVYSTITIEAQGEGALASLLLAQLRVARAVGVQMGGLLEADAGRVQALVTFAAQLGGEDVLLRLGAVQSAAGLAQIRLMAHGVTHSACLELDGSGRPRPAMAWHLAPEGLAQMPSLYENALRSVLRKAVAGAWPKDVQPLRDWADDAALAISIAAH